MLKDWRSLLKDCRSLLANFRALFYARREQLLFGDDLFLFRGGMLASDHDLQQMAGHSQKGRIRLVLLF